MLTVKTGKRANKPQLSRQNYYKLLCFLKFMLTADMSFNESLLLSMKLCLVVHPDK